MTWLNSALSTWRNLPPARRSSIVWFALALLVFIVGVGSLVARSRPAPVPAESTGEVSLGVTASPDWQSGAWAIAATVLVVVAIYGTLWGFKNFTQRHGVGRNSPHLVQVESTVRLSTNQALHVVQFGPEVLLIGASQAGLAVLSRIQTNDAGSVSGAPQAGFEQVFENAMVEKPGETL